MVLNNTIQKTTIEKASLVHISPPQLLNISLISGKFPDRCQSHLHVQFVPDHHYNQSTLCLKKNRTPDTFCNNSNSPGSIAIVFDKNNR